MRTCVLLVAVVAVVACDTGGREAHKPLRAATATETAGDAAPAPSDAPPPSSDASQSTKHDSVGEPVFNTLRRELGAKATECAGVAKIMAGPPFDTGDPAERERVLYKLCTRDRWPLRVRECVASLDVYDVLGCTGYFGDDDRRARKNMNAYFEKYL